MSIFSYSEEVIPSSYYHLLYFGIELFYICFAKSKIATMARECKFIYSQAPAEPAA